MVQKTKYKKPLVGFNPKLVQMLLKGGVEPVERSAPANSPEGKQLRGLALLLEQVRTRYREENHPMWKQLYRVQISLKGNRHDSQTPTILRLAPIGDAYRSMIDDIIPDEVPFDDDAPDSVADNVQSETEDFT